MLLGINLTLLLRNSCSVHMTVFEIVVHRNVDKWAIIGMMYLGANNSSINCRRTLAIHEYTYNCLSGFNATLKML